MGTSTNAKLFYGYVWDDETELWDKEEHGDDDWETRWGRLSGLVPPVKQYPDLPWDSKLVAYKKPTPEQQLVIDEYSAHWARKRELVKDVPVDIGWHGSDGWSVPYVYVKNSYKVAHRGYPQELTAIDLEVGADWDEQLKQFCSFLEIDVSELKIGWWMVSWWG